MVNADDLYRINLRACVSPHTHTHTHVQQFSRMYDICGARFGLPQLIQSGISVLVPRNNVIV